MSKSLKLPSSRLLNIVPIAADMSLIAAGPAAADPQETKVTEHATTDAVTDIGAKGDGVGDILTFANEVFDADDKNKIGTDQGICFRTVPGKTWDAQPGKGQVWPFNHTGDSVFAITGGTSDYAGAQGDMLLSAYGTRATPILSFTG